MEREKLLIVVRAAMAAAAAIVRVTPSTTDDRIYDIAELIVNQVLEIFTDEPVALAEEESEAVELAVFRIRNTV